MGTGLPREMVIGYS